MEAPAGLIQIKYGSTYKGDKLKVDWVELTNIPSFLHTKELEVDCPGLGLLTVDISYGGNFYAIVDPQKNFQGLEHYKAEQLVAYSRVLRQQINELIEVAHPLDSTIKGCSHILWTGSVINPTSTARNAVFYGDKAIDRSPCGTGTSARLAHWFAKGKLKQGEPFKHESIIGSVFIGKIEQVTQLGEHQAIIPSIEGWAKIYGFNTISINPKDDPYAKGFQVV